MVDHIYGFRVSNIQMDKEWTKPSGGKRKEEEEKQAKDKVMKPCHLLFRSMVMHVMK